MLGGRGSLTPQPFSPHCAPPLPPGAGQDTDPQPQEDSGVLGALGQKEDQFGGHRAGLGCSLPALASLSPCTSLDPASSPTERRRAGYPPP